MTTLHGFTLLAERPIAELNLLARYFRHNKTGAELLSLENNDENKVFGVAFRTPPGDSTGVAHIMEHSVLCGSRKFPLKEPFVELMKGSLNTFLNAFTYPDKTCYPVASQNLQDFYNLIDVYMDAVFYPLIPPHVLQQEGWHYELNQPGEPISYKGVVFNEMKGSMSDPDSILAQETQASLFPDTPYAVNSGGDPRVIPNLTYTDFKRFHQRYYHPSNARITFYGDDDPEERLRLMDAWLSEFDAAPVDSAIPLQASFTEPRFQTAPFDPGDDPENSKARLVVNWLLAPADDPQEMLALSILNHILLGTPGSPLRKALIDSGLGEDLAGGGLEDELRQAFFSTGLQGLAWDGTAPIGPGHPVEGLILDTLRRLADEGIDPEQVAASMNTIEFRLRESNFGSFPRGLVAMLRALTTWLHGGDPFAPLAFETPLQTIKNRLAQGEHVFEELIRRSLLDNPHRTTVALLPEIGLTARLDEEERLRLEQAQQAMSQDDLQRILDDTRRLKEIQATPDSPEALATIPALKLEDLDRQARRIPLHETQLQGARLLTHDLFTNGIVYVDVGLDLHRLPQAYLPYASLFGRALLETGAGGDDFVRLLQRIGRSTGGLRATSFTAQVRGTTESQVWLLLRGKATMSQAQDLFNILRDVLLNARLDNRDRFRQMALEEKAGLEASLGAAGHRVVNTRLRSRYSEDAWADEQMDGVEQLFFLRRLVQEVEQNWPAVQARLEDLRRILVNRSTMLVNLTLDNANMLRVLPQVEAFLAALPDQPAPRANWLTAAPGGEENEGLTIPSQVNYVAKGANLFELGYQPTGAVNVIANYLGATWLWERVRVQGGAYGGFCQFNPRTGVFSYLSYRDPNVLATLANYDAAAAFLKNLDLHRDELTRSIIGAIGELDAYQLPDAKGYTSMARRLAGESDELRQAWREQVLDASPQDFHRFGEVLEHLNAAAGVTVLGSPDALARVNQDKPGFLSLTKVL